MNKPLTIASRFGFNFVQVLSCNCWKSVGCTRCGFANKRRYVKHWNMGDQPYTKTQNDHRPYPQDTPKKEDGGKRPS